MDFIEGADDSEPLRPLHHYPRGNDLQNCFPEQNLKGERLRLAEFLLSEMDQELTFVTDVFQSEKLSHHGWTITRNYLSNAPFKARIGGRSGRYELQTSVGVPMIALSAAVEICSLETGNPSAHPQDQNSGAANSLQSLFPGVRTLDEIGAEPRCLALDICLLSYVHEVSHAAFGHCDYQTRESKEIRALEFDADFNAGSMFAAWLPRLPGADRSTELTDAKVKRLVRASLLLGTILGKS